MDQEYGANLITLTDEDGVDYELEILAELEYKGSRYLALIPADADDEESEDDLEISILRAEDDHGEEILVTVDDDEELEAVYNAFMELAFEEESEED